LFCLLFDYLYDFGKVRLMFQHVAVLFVEFELILDILGLFGDIDLFLDNSFMTVDEFKVNRIKHNSNYIVC